MRAHRQAKGAAGTAGVVHASSRRNRRGHGQRGAGPLALGEHGGATGRRDGAAHRGDPGPCRDPA
ncbi:hypothetical protein N867_03550 [Actinotalea fermentans ATCC 43279 = JCM 9966 = DSM 3133]|nr:hypothetical protein N867_03550 [Actinotalea fermentans ATCC 43279 = JCM 9966 = DSM 3133]